MDMFIDGCTDDYIGDVHLGQSKGDEAKSYNKMIPCTKIRRRNAEQEKERRQDDK